MVQITRVRFFLRLFKFDGVMLGVEKEIVETSLRGCVIDVFLMHPGMFYMYIFSLSFPNQPTNQPANQYAHKQNAQTASFTNSSRVRVEGYLVFTNFKNQTEIPRQEKNSFCHYLRGSGLPSHNEYCCSPGKSMMLLLFVRLSGRRWHMPRVF